MTFIAAGMLFTSSAFADNHIKFEEAGINLPAIFFETDKADIKGVDLERLESAASIISSNNLTVVIVGHADERGDRAYNLDLGERRAQAVATKLQKFGVAKSLILSVSYGEERPAAPHGERQHFAANRRVEIIPVKPLEKGPKRNRITLYGGGGPMDLHKHEEATGVDVHQSYNAVFGLGYSRLVTDRWSIGIAGFTNATFMLSIGLDF